MCKAPNRLADGTMVGCRSCSQCRSNKIEDWQGRCIAETKKSGAPFFIALTYGRELDENNLQSGGSDHLRSALLTYSDVQKYFKRLRKGHKINGKWVRYPCRYFAVGEYGSAKGRAHWHLLVWWLGAVPPHEPSTRDNPVRFNEPFWFHGFSTWEPLGQDAENTSAACLYVCKYINKDIGKAERQGQIRLSKLPLIGAAFLHERAGQFVAQGLSPRDLFYSFPDVVGKDGRPKRFMLRPGSKAADLFCQSFLDQWAQAYPCEPIRNTFGRREGQIYSFTGRGRPPPPSDLIDGYGDRMAKGELESSQRLSVKEKIQEEARRSRERAARHMPGTNYDWDTQSLPSRYGLPLPL